MNLYDEFFTLVQRLETSGVPYAVIGGIAMAFHDVPRFTKDIDLLVLPDDVEETRNLVGVLGFVESAKPWTFRSSEATLHRFMKAEDRESLVVDIVAGHEPRHREIIDSAVVEETRAGPVRIARKEDLIWLKELRNSDQDRVDIKKLRNDED